MDTPRHRGYHSAMKNTTDYRIGAGGHDAIVVLGGATAPDGTLAPAVSARVERAVEAWRQGVAPRVIWSGRSGVSGPDDPPITEAAAMARAAERLGMPGSVMLLEENARDTVGNAYFVKRDFLDPNGWRSLRVVTSDFHLSRAAWVFRKILGPGYDFAFTSASSGFSPRELIVRALEECRLSIFLNEWLEMVEEGDEVSVEALMRHHHPAYADAPTLTHDEMRRRLAEIERLALLEGTGGWVPASRRHDDP